MRPTLFLDRDGVLNHDTGYTHKWADFRMPQGAGDGLRLFAAADFQFVVISNQSGIGKGLYSEADFWRFNAGLADFYQQNFQITLDLRYFFYCPHDPDGPCAPCDCRKPQLGLFQAAAQRLSVAWELSLMVGDRHSDIEAGKKLGIPAYQIMTGEFDKSPLAKAHFITLLELAQTLKI